MTLPITAPADYVPQTAVAFAAPDGAAVVSAHSPLPVSEPSYRSARALELGTTFDAPRAIAVIAQGVGVAAFRFADDSEITVPISSGLTILPFAATEIMGSGTTAIASFYALV